MGPLAKHLSLDCVVYIKDPLNYPTKNPEGHREETISLRPRGAPTRVALLFRSWSGDNAQTHTHFRWEGGDFNLRSYVGGGVCEWDGQTTINPGGATGGPKQGTGCNHKAGDGVFHTRSRYLGPRVSQSLNGLLYCGGPLTRVLKWTHARYSKSSRPNTGLGPNSTSRPSPREP
jgi:hypothetical protein